MTLFKATKLDNQKTFPVFHVVHECLKNPSLIHTFYHYSTDHELATIFFPVKDLIPCLCEHTNFSISQCTLYIIVGTYLHIYSCLRMYVSCLQLDNSLKKIGVRIWKLGEFVKLNTSSVLLFDLPMFKNNVGIKICKIVQQLHT